MNLNDLLLMTEERPWLAFAACRGVDPAIFFPGGDGQPDEAMKICGGCPVQAECLDYSLMARERYGVWGGATERERRRLLRQTG